MDQPSGSTQTSGHSVSVMAAPTGRLKLTVSVQHPDADRNPVEVDVWVDRRRVVHGRFARGVPLIRTVDVPGNNQRFVFETTVDRTFASPETRRSEVGLDVAWEFVGAN